MTERRTEEPEAEIRPAAAGDLPLLEALERGSFPEPWSRRLLAEELRYPASLLLVAARGGRVAGYAAFRRAAGEAELLRVAVAPPERSRGVGRALVQAGLAELERAGVTRCFLEVRPGNAAARALYRRLGFREVGRRPGYYADGSEALVLAKELGTERPADAGSPVGLDRVRER